MTDTRDLRQLDAAIDTVVARIVLPMTAVAGALFAAERGWGVLQLVNWPAWLDTLLLGTLRTALIGSHRREGLDPRLAPACRARHPRRTTSTYALDEKLRKSATDEIINAIIADGFTLDASDTKVQATAAAVLADPPANFFVLSAHKYIPPVMEIVAEMPDTRVEGFLAAGHAATITGWGIFERFVVRHRGEFLFVEKIGSALLVGAVFGFAAGYMAKPRALQTVPPAARCGGVSSRRSGGDLSSS